MTDDNIVTLLPGARSSKARRDLARWLRGIADTIESGESETNPHGAIVCLSGTEQHEVLFGGYNDDDEGLTGAAQAVVPVCLHWFPTVGKNVRPRLGPYGSPLRHRENIVQFALPRGKGEGRGEDG